MATPVVLITGARTDIGRATAFAFARERARIVISGRKDEEGKKLAAEFRVHDAEAELLHSDVRRLVDQVVARFGRLDVVVNNMGTEGKLGPPDGTDCRHIRGHGNNAGFMRN